MRSRNRSVRRREVKRPSRIAACTSAIVAQHGSPSAITVTRAILSHDFECGPRVHASHLGARASIISNMTSKVGVGTREGLWWLERDQAFPVETFTGKTLTALALDGPRDWAVVDGRTLWECVDSIWRERATIPDGPEATCLASTPGGLLIGTEQAHLLRFH